MIFAKIFLTIPHQDSHSSGPNRHAGKRRHFSQEASQPFEGRPECHG
jgi:hypothetical protein